MTTCAPRCTSTVRGRVPNSHDVRPGALDVRGGPGQARPRLGRDLGLQRGEVLAVASGRCWSSSTRNVARRWSGTWSGAQASGGMVTAVGPAQLALQRRQQRLARVDVREHLAHPVGDGHQAAAQLLGQACAAAPSPVPRGGPGR